MGIIGGWISNLVVFLIAAFLLELLLPSSDLQKYTRLVLSFILMLIIIEPIVHLTKQDFETEWDSFYSSSYELDNIKSEINIQKNEIEEGQDAYISEQVAEHLENQAEKTVKERWGWEVKKLDLQWKGEDIKNLEDVVVNVQLAPFEKASTNQSIEPVNVQIGKENDYPSIQKKQEILSFLEDTWGISANQIRLETEEEGGW